MSESRVVRLSPGTGKTSMITYYAQRAAEYERIYHKPERQEDLRALRGWVEDEFAGVSVLEVACGTGYWTEVLARTARAVVATDINEEVLAIARSKRFDSGKVEFRRDDAYALPRLDRIFDGGFSGFWWSHVPKVRLRAFLTGFHAALKPGARVMFLDNRYVAGSSTPVSRADEDGNTYQLRHLDNGSTHEVLKNFPSEDELCAAVEGLAEQVNVRLLPHYWVLSCVIP